MISSTDYSIALDISLSMKKAHGDLVPSKLEAAREAAALAASRILSAPGNRVALVIFHGRALPLVHLTSDYRRFISALSRVDFVEEGSAIGDGIVEAVKMLRGSARRKRVIALTDGGYTEGVPVQAAALYARYSGAEAYILTLGEPLGRRPLEALEDSVKRAGAVWIHSGSKSELLSNVMKVVSHG